MLLTDTQQAVLDFVIDFEAGEGRPPSLSEVADEYGWTRAKAQRAVDGTIQAGALSRAENRTRSLRVTDRGWRDRARRESRLRGVELSPAACRVCIAAQRHLAAIPEPRERQSVIEALCAGYRGLALPAS